MHERSAMHRNGGRLIPIVGQSFTRPYYRPFGTYRLVLATLVLLSHSFWLSLGGDHFLSRIGVGNVGVMSFFVLSGFVISEALSSFYQTRPAAFLLNRFNRLYPPFLAALAISVGLHAWAGQGSFITQNLLANTLALVPLA